MRLLELWEGHWTAERALDASEFPHCPDGLFTFATGNRIAVEVERTAKGKERFLGILDSWRNCDVLAILYVAISDEVFRALQKNLECGPKGVPFGLARWKDLERGLPSVWSTRGELDFFSRRSL